MSENWEAWFQHTLRTARCAETHIFWEKHPCAIKSTCLKSVICVQPGQNVSMERLASRIGNYKLMAFQKCNLNCGVSTIYRKNRYHRRSAEQDLRIATTQEKYKHSTLTAWWTKQLQSPNEELRRCSRRDYSHAGWLWNFTRKPPWDTWSAWSRPSRWWSVITNLCLTME